VLPIHVPPLRDRREDIPLLIEHFVHRNNSRLGTEVRGLDSEARRLMYEYGWPGNVRELENTIERAMVLAEGQTVIAADLPERIREARDPVQMQLATGELSVKKTTRIIEEILIRRALQKTKGNRTRAAELLEISHRSVVSGRRPQGERGATPSGEIPAKSGEELAASRGPTVFRDPASSRCRCERASAPRSAR
jgi:two-component system response regulator AtoC